jgi:hypothetical protein
MIAKWVSDGKAVLDVRENDPKLEIHQDPWVPLENYFLSGHSIRLAYRSRNRDEPLLVIGSGRSDARILRALAYLRFFGYSDLYWTGAMK